MRALMLGSVLAVMSLGAAVAQERAAVAPTTLEAGAAPTKADPVARKIFVCDKSDLTRRSFTREFGAIEFVTADQALDAKAAWTAPKCMRSSEHARLKHLQMAAR